VQPPLAGSWYAGQLAATRDKYLRDWTLAKGARFNAAKRFERKSNASTMAFAIAGIVGFVVPYFVQLFGDAITPHARNVLNFYSYITGLLSLSLGLIEQARGYPSMSRRFDECGRQLNRVVCRLRNYPALDERELQSLVDEYEKALDVCDVNHDPIDRDLALAEEAAEHARRAERSGHATSAQLAEAERRLWRLRWLETIQIYLLYWLVLLAPSLVAFTILLCDSCFLPAAH
jgi:hypothetical protein